MKTMVALLCGLVATGCATNKPADSPTESAQSTTATTAEPVDMAHTDPAPGTPAGASIGDAKPSMAVDAGGGRATNGAPTGAANGQTGVVATPAPAPDAPAPGTPSRPDADNTRVNRGDTGTKALTPIDQGNGKTDLKITQQIRKAVVGDSSLSFTAKNVKIITVNGRVTLRGPVKTDQERATIEAAAKQIAGDAQVDNQLEVKK